MKRLIMLTLLLAAGAWGAITITDIQSNKLFQRIDRSTGYPPIVDQATGLLSDSVAPIPIVYTLTDAQDSVMALVLSYTDYLDTVTNWKKISTSPSSGVHTDTLKYVVHNNFQYRLEVKEMPSNNISSGTTAWGVGMFIAPGICQSHATGYATDSLYYQMQNNGIAFKYTSGAWYPFTSNFQSASQTDSVNSIFGRLVDSLYSGMTRKILIGVIDRAVGNRGMIGTPTVSYWYNRNAADPDDATYQYGWWLNVIQNYKPEIIINFQGEKDSENNIARADYVAAWKTIYNTWMLADLGYKPRAFVIGLEAWPMGSTTGSVAKIQMAHGDLPDDTAIFYGSSTYDLKLNTGVDIYNSNVVNGAYYHLTASSQNIVGGRCAGNIIKYFNGTIDDGYRFRILSDTMKSPMNISIGIEIPSGDAVTAYKPNGFTVKNKFRYITPLRVASSGSGLWNMQIADLGIKQTPILWAYAYTDKDPIDSVIYSDNGIPLEPFSVLDTLTIASTIYAKTDTIKYWLGTTSADPAVAANWSDTSGGSAGAVVPDSTMHWVFDVNGNNACTFSAATTKARSITIDSAYTANFSTNAKTLQLNGSFSARGKTLTVNGPVNILTDGDFHIGAYTTGNITASRIEMFGNGLFGRNSPGYQDCRLLSLSLAKPGKINNIYQAYGTITGPRKLICGGGKINVGSPNISTSVYLGIYPTNEDSIFIDCSKKSIIAINEYLYCYPTPTANNAHYILNDSIDFKYRKYYALNDRPIFTIQKNASYNMKVQLSMDSLNLIKSEFRFGAGNFSGTCTLDVQSKSLKFQSFKPYNSNASSSIYVYYDDATIELRGNVNIKSFDASNLTNGNFYENLQTSLWSINRDYLGDAQRTVVAGTSTTYFDSVTAVTTANINPAFDNLVFNNSDASNSSTFADTIKTSGDLTVSDGRFSQTKPIFVGRDFVITNTDSTIISDILNISRNYTANSNSKFRSATNSNIQFTAGASHTMAAAGKTYARVTTSGPLTITGGATISALSYGINGVPVTVAEGTKITIGSMTIGGSAGALDTMRSGTPGAQCTLDLAGTQKITVSYAAIGDVYLADGDTVVVSDGTSVDLGNNSGNVVFPASGTTRRRGGLSGLVRGLWLGL
jgi:hypothetical protein